jgi:hypothetical protein
MSDTKFTEGPWCVSSKNPTIIMRDFSLIGSDSGQEIGSTMGHDNSGFYVTKAEAIANAHLFAASPSLYEKVVELHSYLIEEDQNYMGSQAYLETKFLLAKARGDAQ